MGFLKRMFGGGEPAFEDRIWMRSDLKLEDAVRRIAADAQDEGVACVVAYHFPASAESLRSRLEAAGLTCEEIRQPDATQLEALPSRLGTWHVGLLHSGGLSQEVKLGQARRSASGAGSRPCRVHLFEHHPMLYRDTHVLNLHALLPEGSAFFGYAALDEPWLDRHLGSVRPLLERLGIDESERLEHAMLSGAVRKAQAQLGRRLRKSEQHADSLEEWVSRNLGG